MNETINMNEEIKKSLSFFVSDRDEDYTNAIRRLLTILFDTKGLELIEMNNKELKYIVHSGDYVNFLDSMELLGYVHRIIISDSDKIYLELRLV